MDPSTDLHPYDPSKWSFALPEQIIAWGGLTPDNVMEYFALSFHYDRASNNEVLRMQTMHTAPDAKPFANQEEELKRFTGIEFALIKSEPPSLFIIQKRERISSEEVRPITNYFIQDGVIYEGPSVYHLLSTRFTATLSAIQSSMTILHKHRPEFAPRMGFVWPIIDPAAEEAQRRREKAQAVSLETAAPAGAANTTAANTAPASVAGTPMPTGSSIVAEDDAPTPANNNNNNRSGDKIKAAVPQRQKRQDESLMWNALNIAAHHMSLSAPPSLPADDSTTAAGGVTDSAGGKGSDTVTRAGTPAIGGGAVSGAGMSSGAGNVSLSKDASTSLLQDAAGPGGVPGPRGPAGGGKKKRKREARRMSSSAS